MSAISALSSMSLDSNTMLAIAGDENINRRRSERRTMTGSAMATFMDAHGPAALTRVKLLDQSHTGWGVLSDVEVKPGATFWFVPEQGTGMRQTGTVAYCTQTDEGWRLGLRKRSLRAVA